MSSLIETYETPKMIQENGKNFPVRIRMISLVFDLQARMSALPEDALPLKNRSVCDIKEEMYIRG